MIPAPATLLPTCLPQPWQGRGGPRSEQTKKLLKQGAGPYTGKNRGASSLAEPGYKQL